MLVDCLIYIIRREPLLGGTYDHGKYGVSISQTALGGSGNVRDIATDDELSSLLNDAGLSDSQVREAFSTLKDSSDFKARQLVEYALLVKYGF